LVLGLDYTSLWAVLCATDLFGGTLKWGFLEHGER
jgi:hypothetical protein